MLMGRGLKQSGKSKVVSLMLMGRGPKPSGQSQVVLPRVGSPRPNARWGPNGLKTGLYEGVGVQRFKLHRY